VPPPPPDPSSMDVSSMLSIMEGTGYNISRLGTCRGKNTVSKAFKKIGSFVKSNRKLLLCDCNPPEEKATEKDNASEKEEETAGGQYVFMLFTYFVEAINIVFGKSTTKTCGCCAEGYVRNKYRRVWSMLLLLISFVTVGKMQNWGFQMP
jgi:hypothetical protein